MKQYNKFLSLLLVLTIFAFMACTGNQASTALAEQEVELVKVKDVKGEVEIPKNPQRIVDISGKSDILSILGMKVVGTANSDAYDRTKFPSYLENALKDAKIVGYSMQDTMDIENIISLDPDLIIMTTHQEKMYEQLKTIAPTVMLSSDALNYRNDIYGIAEIFNLKDKADEWLKNYDEKAQKSHDEIVKAKTEETSYLSFLASGGKLYVFDAAGIGDVLYNDLKLKKPEGMPTQSNISLPVVSYEGLADIKADYIFCLSKDKDEEDLKKNPIWNAIPAVKEGRVIYLPSSPYFNQGYSAIGRELLLDEIKDLLIK